MNNIQIFSAAIMTLFCGILSAQNGTISGTVTIEDEPIEFATVTLANTTIGTSSSMDGTYTLSKIPFGEHTLTVDYLGYKSKSFSIRVNASNPSQILNVTLSEKSMELDAIVVTGTKTFKRKTNTPVIVNIVSSKKLNNVQACNLSEGLRFQPGLRVETDCQTCNYTQLRMNGLGGGYSQILINGRPIFSPLTGLYGLEQVPVNMIDRIEVVRGGGSSLYGSSAIGGTVNVITKLPKKSNYAVDYSYQNINGQTSDHSILGNGTIVSKNKKTGTTFFLARRERDFYDHNDDNYSELPKIKNSSMGFNTFYLPKKNHKLEFNLSHLHEYRFGGEMVDKPAYLTQQSEERTHNVWMGSADYQINFSNQASLIGYVAAQNTKRNHYTGIIPDDAEELQAHIENPPYGISNVTTYNVGLQYNHRIQNFLRGTNVLTVGSEYVYDNVFDEIETYNYLIDQKTKNVGLFVQSDWSIIPNTLTLLSGVRADHHNLVDKVILSPRVSLLYKLAGTTQFRLNYGTGFRAPQAFDTDLHIAFAGGGISRVTLSPNLIPERSQTVNASINYDKPSDHYIFGFTLEAFYTQLKNAFILNPNGSDQFGELFEKQNGQGATVKGITLEGRANYDKKIQLEAGYTIQSSLFDEKIDYIEGVEGQRAFTRTPNQYGFATLSLTPTPKWNANISYIYTGSMSMPHFAGAPNQTIDEMFISKSFHEINTKIAYTFSSNESSSGVEIYGGVKNIFNSYQKQFDIGKNRDSNFIYGPSAPRTFFIGVKLKSL